MSPSLTCGRMELSLGELPASRSPSQTFSSQAVSNNLAQGEIFKTPCLYFEDRVSCNLEQRMTLSFWSSSLCLLRAGFTSVYCLSQVMRWTLDFDILQTKQALYSPSSILRLQNTLKLSWMHSQFLNQSPTFRCWEPHKSQFWREHEGCCVSVIFRKSFSSALVLLFLFFRELEVPQIGT